LTWWLSLVLTNLFKIIKKHSKTQIGLQPPSNFGMKLTRNSNNYLKFVNVSWSDNNWLYKSVSKLMNSFFVAKYFICDEFKLDYPELLFNFNDFISFSTSSDVNYNGACYVVISYS
jgi:hypothetical protein